jgi:hypothetical protein
VLGLIFAGAPSRADYPRVRAKPLAKPKRYDSPTKDGEVELIRRWWGDGDLDALDELVGAHRPMVVRLARRFARGNPRKLAAFVEYGMFGLIEAAAPPRPSLTKKGAVVGFDPSKYRFSTYARHYAEKMMRTATPDWEPPQHVVDSKMEFDEWAKTPIPEEVECAGPTPPRSVAKRNFAAEMTAAEFGEHQHNHLWRDEQPHQRRVNPAKRFEQIRWWRGMFGITTPLVYEIEEERAAVFLAAGTPVGVIGPWHVEDTSRTELELRRKTRWNDAEYAAKDRYYAGYWGKLGGFEAAAKDGLEGWGDNEDPARWTDGGCPEPEEVWHPSSPAFAKDEYKLPAEVIELRLKLAVLKDRAALSNEIDWKALALFKGFGLYNKHGTCHIWPIYSLPNEKIIERKRLNTPFLRKHHLASIYSMRGKLRAYVMLLAAVLYFNMMEI